MAGLGIQTELKPGRNKKPSINLQTLFVEDSFGKNGRKQICTVSWLLHINIRYYWFLRQTSTIILSVFLCTICKPQVDETVTHLLLDCKMAKLINEELCMLWTEWTGETIQFSQDWILLQVSKSKFKDTLRQFAVISMWTTWNTRNLRDFQKIELTELGVKQYLYSEIRSWISTMHTDLQNLGLASSTIQSRMEKVLLNEKVGSISNGTLNFTEWSTRLVQDPNVII